MADPEDFDFDKEFGDFEDVVGDFDEFADFGEFEGDAGGSVYEEDEREYGEDDENQQPRTKIVVKQQYTEEEKEMYKKLRETYRRARDIQQRVKLNETTYDIYAAPPKTAYELYARKTTHQTTSTSVGTDYTEEEKEKKKEEGGGLRQAAVQCPPAENFMAKKNKYIHDVWNTNRYTCTIDDGI